MAKRTHKSARARMSSAEDDTDHSEMSGSEFSFVDSMDGDTSDEGSGNDSEDDMLIGGSDTVMDLGGFDLAQLEEGQDEDEVAAIEEQIVTFDPNNANTGEQDVEDEDGGTEEDRLYNGNRAPPEFYEQIMKGTNPVEFKRKHYATGTSRQLDNCKFFWTKFCKESLKTDDWEQCCKKINFQVVYTFLWWYLNQATGRNGRAKRPLSKMSSLITFWCCFRLFFERVTTKKIDRGLPRGTIGNALVTLGKKFKLDHEKKENRSMTLSDLKLQIETTLFTTSKQFQLGEMRILAVLFLLLLAPQGSRPQSILNIKFKHINILLIRDPENPTGPPRLTIRLRLEETKEYRGSKPVKTFLVPEIIYDPSLFLCPHVFLLAILFRHRAFEAEALNDNPHVLSTLKIHSKANELRLNFKDEVKDLPLFRKCERGLLGFEMSSDAITQSITGKWIKSIGKLLGFEHTTIAYNLRYFAGNSLDQNANISSSLRNLVMDHAPNSDTFQRHYLNRHVCADLWAIHRDRNPQEALIRQATSHGGSRDGRRSFTLSSDQIKDIKKDRQYQRLTAQYESKSIGSRFSEKRKEVGRLRRNLFLRLKTAKLKEVAAEWTRQQALKDVEQQIRGDTGSFSADEHEKQEREKLALMSEAQQNMYKALTAPLVSDYEAICQRRTLAIQALVAYCSEEEPLQTKVTEANRPPPPAEFAQGGPQRQQLREIKKSILVKSVGEGKVRRCFLCVAKALSLGRTHQSFYELCRDYCSPHSLARHFVRIHMKNLPQEHKFKCPTCSTILVDIEHLRAHADRIHGIDTDRRIDGKQQ